jgi:hypothetical protein
MKKLLVLTGALLVMSASIASAQINLAWRNCIAITAGGASALQNVNYACDGSLNGVPFKGVLSFIAPANTAHFVGADALLDVQTADPTLPDFWQLGLGECRDGNFSYPASLTGIGNTGSCRNPFAGGGTGGGFQYDVQPGGVRARVQLAFARADEFALVAGAQYIAGMFTLDTFKDVDLGDGECAGCAVPACLVLNQINVLQTAGQTPPSQDQNVLTAAATRQYITWQGGAVGGAGCPAETPTKNKTWGSVKSLYR